MGLIRRHLRRHVRRLYRQKVRKPVRAALRGIAESWCPDCQRTAPPFHVCAPKSDFRQRRAQQARAERRRNRPQASARRTRREAHDYAACADRACRNRLCTVYREGQDACPLPHQ